MQLVGRVEESATIDGLVEGARNGKAATLVLRGEPGVGKTALVEHAIGSAVDFQIVHMTGIEAERELGFAALHRLITPIIHRIAKLPEAQRGAMSSAFGLGPLTAADRFMVGLATVTLAAEAASFSPLLCVIDDAQWIDRESIDALAFWGRRLYSEQCLLIFAERELFDEASPLEGLPVLHVEGLTPHDARTLLVREAHAALDPGVAERLIAETVGNPLALVELANDLTADQLTGGFPLPEPLPLSRRVEERFLRQVRSLPAATQSLLVLAAADPTGDIALLWSAAAVIGISPESSNAAEAEGLLSLLPKVTFRHPLIRSAVYSGASPAERRRVHAALAAATDAAVDADRRAWHLAAAAAGPDEQVAVELERAATRAGARGGRVAERAFLTRAAELSPKREDAAARWVLAAEAALAADSPNRAQTLIEIASPWLHDRRQIAVAERVVGRAWILRGRASTAAPMLLSSAIALRSIDPASSRFTMLEAFEAAALSGHVTVSKQQLADAGLRDWDSNSAGDGSIVDMFLNAFGAYTSKDYATAVPLLRTAVTAAGADDVTFEQIGRWPILASNAALALWDHEAHARLMHGLARRSRELGILRCLESSLLGCATAELWAGRLASAQECYVEADEASRVVNSSSQLALMDVAVSALRGDESATQSKAATIIDSTTSVGLSTGDTHARQWLAVMLNSTGHYQAALDHARVVFDDDPEFGGNQILPEVVEAAVRAGDVAVAAAALDRLAERAGASGTTWALGVLARSRALLADDASAEASYVAAIELLDSTRLVVEIARARLVYGEWLRRQKRRAEARDMLRSAHDAFVAIGADGFADRARHELLATGERARKRSVTTSNDLTPQEAHVARLAAAGETNSEIAARLFISASTVEYHLRKVFRKLDVTSRRQLRHRLPG